MHRHLPRELQVGGLDVARHSIRHHTPGLTGVGVAVLDQQAALHSSDVGVAAPRARGLEDPEGLLLRQDRPGLLGHPGTHQHLDELASDRLRRGPVDHTVHRHHPSEGRGGVAGPGHLEGAEDVFAVGRPTGIGVLDDGHTAGLGVGEPPSRLGIGVVVERHLLALELGRLPPPRAGSVLEVDPGRLVRVLPVSELGNPAQGDHPIVPDPGNDGGVVGGGVEEGLGGERSAQCVSQPTVLDCLGHDVVLVRGRHHPDVTMVLGRGPHHGRPTDVDLLDDLVLGDVGKGHRLPKRVEGDHHQLESGDPLLGQLFGIGLVVGPGQDPSEDPGVEGLHPATQDLRGPADLADGAHGDPGDRERHRGPTRRDDLDTRCHQTLCERDQPGLVVDADQGAAHRDPGHDHLTRPSSTTTSPLAKADTTRG